MGHDIDQVSNIIFPDKYSKESSREGESTVLLRTNWKMSLTFFP